MHPQGEGALIGHEDAWIGVVTCDMVAMDMSCHDHQFILEQAMANTRYQLEGNAPQLYEQFNVPTSTRPSAELMLENLSLHEGDRVLDAACGTGIVTRLIAERFGNIRSIVGMDLNPGMLDVARANTPKTGVPIEWKQGDLCALPFPDNSFDVVLCNQGMQFVPDKSVALGEIQRVLVPGGRLAFAVWGNIHPHARAVADALTRHISAEVAASSLSGYALRDADTIRQLVDAAGFHHLNMQELSMTRRDPATTDTVLAYIARSPYAREIAAITEDARQAIGQEVVDALQPYLEGNDFVVPQKVHLVQALA